MDKLPNITRYPGIRAFERAEKGRFFGRHRETADLFNMVKVKPLTVLFAKSGIGKTSLINAGISPLLEQSGYLPVKVRLQDTTLTPVETVKKVLAPWFHDDRLHRFGQAPFSLWEYLRACRFENDEGVQQVPVLIFDQFEELFNHPVAEQETLTLALADLINERLPETVQARFRSFPRQERSEELLDWFSPQKIRILFAIRADRMGDLDRLKRHIPTVLHDRFYLAPLDHAAARDAIVQPAALAGKQFLSEPFTYSETALETMLQGLENDRGEVESFQLQILCQQLEKIAAEKQRKTIQPADFGGAEGIRGILNDYYEREVDKLPAAEQDLARRFIEEGLIVNGRRVGIPEGAEQSQFGLSPDLLEKLLDSRLIRTEVIHLGKIYELSHDTLVEPVLRSYEQRRIREERAAAAKALEEERTRLAALAQKRRRARLYAIAGFTLAALALVGGFFAWQNYRKAEAARQAALVSNLAAKAWDVYRDDHTLAFRLAEAALRLDSTNADARQTLRSIANMPTTTFYQQVFTGHQFEVKALAFSPDGQLVASGSFDKTIALWRRSDGALLARLDFVYPEENTDSSGHSGTIRSVTFAPDGQTLWSTAVDGRVKHLDLQATVIGGFRAHSKPVWDMALAPDGRWLVTASNDSTAAIWRTDGTKLKTLAGHRDAVWTTAISPDGRWIITGSIDGTARLWTADGQLRQVIDLQGAKVNASAFSPDSRFVLLGCGDNTAKLLRLDGRLEAIYSGHSAEITEVAFSPDGLQVLTASNDHSAKVWKRSGEELLHLVGHTERVGALAISPDGQWVSTGSFDFTAKIWNLPFNLHNKATFQKGPVTKVAVSPDGRLVLSGSEDNTVNVWRPDGQLAFQLHGHRKEVAQVGFSPAGNRFFSVSPDATVCIWDSAGALVHRLDQFPNAVYAAAFAPPDGRHLLVASGPDIFLLDSTGKLQRRWKAHTGNIIRLQYAPDGKSLLSASSDGTVKIWTEAGALLDSLNTRLYLYWASFAPDGKHVATVGNELPVREWQVSDTTSRQFLGHLMENYFVDYSPDGRQLVSCSWDKTARLWDRQTGAELLRLPHPDGVNGGAFSPDGKRLYTACRDKRVRVWDTATGELLTVFGDNPDVRPFLQSGAIARLEAIPVQFERYGIAPDMALRIYGGQPASIRALGLRLLALGKENLAKPEQCREYLQTAEIYLLDAQKQDNPAQQAQYDSLLAEVYIQFSNLYLVNRDFPQMLKSAQKGLQYHALPMLKVHETFGLLLTSQYEQAKRKALKLCQDSTTVVFAEYYYFTYRDAFLGELDYYQHQLSIPNPDLQRLGEALAQ
ncbi:MAG: WD40 repeat domain-containing protein [Saprospiraceae bacterium]